MICERCKLERKESEFFDVEYPKGIWSHVCGVCFHALNNTRLMWNKKHPTNPIP